MQDLTSSDITNMVSGTHYRIRDNRDNQIYCIAKLEDGKVWMLNNLTLNISDTNIQGIMYDDEASPDAYSVNTNAKNSTLDKLFNGGGASSDQYPTRKLNGLAWDTSSNNYSAPMAVVSGTCSDRSDQVGWCVDATDNRAWSYDDELPATINNTTSIAQGKIGIYYNYCVASAGSYCYGSNSNADTSSGDATEDLCSAGWRMPKGGTSSGSDYYALMAAYSSNGASLQVALSTPLSGDFSYGEVFDQGNSGRFWASTRGNGNQYMKSVVVSSPSGFSHAETYRGQGASIRCIADL